MIYFLRRGDASLTCETRLGPNGDEYELVVTDGGGRRVETFGTVAAMLAREHDLLAGWRAQGWQDVTPVRPAASRGGWKL